MQRASEILGTLASGSKSTDGERSVFDHEQIACAAWSRAVGKRLAKYTRAAKLVRGRLVVEVEDVLWQRNLFGMTRQILGNLERTIGKGIVSDLEFRVVPARREPKRAETIMPSTDESDAISDPGLRRIYRAARQKESA